MPGTYTRVIEILERIQAKYTILYDWLTSGAYHIRTVVRIFRIWTGVPDVVYLAGIFKLCIVMCIVFLDVSPLQTCVSFKSYR